MSKKPHRETLEALSSLCFRIPLELKRRLKVYAIDREQTIAELVTEALEQKLKATRS